MDSTTPARSSSEEELACPRTVPDDSTDPATPDDRGAERNADAKGSISADDLFGLLQNSRRRAVVRYLYGREGPVRMRDVAEQVAAWEHDTTVEQLTSKERQRVYIALYQSHLEKLAEVGVIDYNKPRGIVDPKPLLDRVASYVDTDPTETTEADAADEWTWRYLSVSVLGSVLLVGTAIDLAVLRAIPNVAAGVLVLSMFSVLTLSRLVVDG